MGFLSSLRSGGTPQGCGPADRLSGRRSDGLVSWAWPALGPVSPIATTHGHQSLANLWPFSIAAGLMFLPALRSTVGCLSAPRLSISLAAVVLTPLTVTQAAKALPFDPVPSAFQQWLNASSPGRPALPVVVSDLGECVDHSQASSPYRVPAYTCLRGTVALRQDPARRCPIDRLIYFPSMERLRLQTSPSCAASAVIPASISLQNRAPLPTSGVR